MARDWGGEGGGRNLRRLKRVYARSSCGFRGGFDDSVISPATRFIFRGRAFFASSLFRRLHRLPRFAESNYRGTELRNTDSCEKYRRGINQDDFSFVIAGNRCLEANAEVINVFCGFAVLEGMMMNDEVIFFFHFDVDEVKIGVVIICI